MTTHGQDDVAVITIGGEEVTRLPVGSIQRVDRLKQHIEEHSGYPQESQKILHGSNTLQDLCCLGDLSRPLTLIVVLDTTNLWKSFRAAVQGEKPRAIGALLRLAEQEGRYTMLYRMLTHRPHAKTPLLVTTKKQDVGASRLIVSAAETQGVLLQLLQVEDEGGRTACHWAASSGNVELLEILTKHVQEVDLPGVLLASDGQGRMPVHCAARNGKFKVCEWILEMAWAEDREEMLDKDVDGRTLRALLKDEGYEYEELPDMSSEEEGSDYGEPVAGSSEELARAERRPLPPQPTASALQRLGHLRSAVAAARLVLALAWRVLLSVCGLLLHNLGEVTKQCALTVVWLSHALLMRQAEGKMRVAFLVGQKNYREPWAELGCTWHDVEEIDKVLRNRCGFQVTVMHDASRNWLQELGRLLAQNLRGERGGVLMLYFAGHAMSVQDDIFLVPTDAESGDVSQCVSLHSILQLVHDIAGGLGGSSQRAARKASARTAAGSTILVVVDGCRVWPRLDSAAPLTPKRISEAGPPRPVDTSVCVLYACDPGLKAHEDGEHGIFSRAFIEALQIPLLPWFKVWEKTHGLCVKFAKEQKKQQRPWNTDSLAAQDLVLNTRCPLL